jgi:hypothetical protein
MFLDYTVLVPTTDPHVHFQSLISALECIL